MSGEDKSLPLMTAVGKKQLTLTAFAGEFP